MVLSFVGSDNIENELDVKSRLRRLIGYYARKGKLTVMCAEGNRFDELVCDAAFNVGLHSPFPVSAVAIALDLESIRTHPLTILCDEVRFYTGKSNIAVYNDDKLWLEESDLVIGFLHTKEKCSAAAYYQYAVDADIPTIFINLDLKA